MLFIKLKKVVEIKFVLVKILNTIFIFSNGENQLTQNLINL